MYRQTEDPAAQDPGWVDDVLFAGRPTDVCLRLPEPVDRATLHRLVTEAQARLVAAGLRPGGAAALRLPPSLSYVVNLLATWRSGGQAVLLDHRLTDHEVDRALRRLTPQVVVAPVRTGGGALKVFVDVTESVTGYADRPAVSGHAVIQLSSGSTGPSKVIGRTAADLVAEVERYTRIDGVALPGERIILLPSMVHVLGLVGGLLYGLHARVELVPPERLGGDAVLAAIAAQATRPPCSACPSTSVCSPPHATDRPLPQFTRMTTGGELVRTGRRAGVHRPARRTLGNMYGMTEVGVIAHRPARRAPAGHAPAPGIEVRESDGELLIAAPPRRTSGSATPTAGRTAGCIPATPAPSTRSPAWSPSGAGSTRRSPSGGLKVDLTEVEATLTGLPGVAAAVVTYDDGITAYVQPDGPLSEDALDRLLAERLAGYKRPRTLHLVAQLPRTTTGKLVRSLDVLRTAAP